MTKKTRTFLFFILFFFFLIIVPPVILYSFGFRFNFETKKLVKTGAFYFKVLPKPVQIYLTPLDTKGFPSKKPKIFKKTDFFFGAVLIDDLLPKKYEVEIKKDGFHPWKKILEVKENQVTEAKNIVLIPKDVKFDLLTKNTEDFFFSPDEKIVILKEKNETDISSATPLSPKNNKSIFSLKILELEKNIKSHLMESNEISKDSEVNLLDLKFSPDSKRILLKVNLKNQLKYYLIDLNQVPPKKISLDFLDAEIEDISFHPKDPQKLFVFGKGDIFEADLTEKKISSKILENIKSFQIFNGDFYYLDNTGFLFKTDLSFSGRQKINSNPFPLEKEGHWQIYIFQNWIFLKENEKLFWFNPESNSFEKLFETKKDLKISPDFKKIVYASDYEVWIFFLKPELGQPQKKAGEKVFIARFSEKIDEVFFFTSHYLIFNSGNKIKIAEIDDRDVINIIDLTEFKSPKIFWDKIYKKLFILSEGNFYCSKTLLP